MVKLTISVQSIARIHVYAKEGSLRRNNAIIVPTNQQLTVPKYTLPQYLAKLTESAGIEKATYCCDNHP